MFTQRFYTIGGLSLVAVLSFAAATIADDKPQDAAKPKSEAAARFELLKSLAGTWRVLPPAEGEAGVTGTFNYRVTAAGSAVIETLFVGSGHEMVSVYTLDGDDLLMTHYCAVGNQPHCKAAAGGALNTLKFEFVKLVNGKPETDRHMHEGVITIISKDRIRQEWQGWDGGKPAGDHKVLIELERVPDAEKAAGAAKTTDGDR